MLNSKVIRWAGVFLASVLGLVAGPVAADWPEKPIRLIVPYSPGGGFDTFARAFAPELEKELGTDPVS